MKRQNTALTGDPSEWPLTHADAIGIGCDWAYKADHSAIVVVGQWTLSGTSAPLHESPPCLGMVRSSL